MSGRSGYLITGDCSFFTRSANAYQKCRLVADELDGFIVLPDGCDSWVHEEFRSRILKFPFPKFLLRGVACKLATPLMYLVAFYALRSQIEMWFAAPANELTYFGAWMAELIFRKRMVLFCSDPPGITVRDRRTFFSRLRCRLMDYFMGMAIRRSSRLILNLHPGFVEGRFPVDVQKHIVSFPNGTLVGQNEAIASGCVRVLHRIAVNSKFEKAKGCLKMARLFIEVKKSIPDATLVWTGGGCDREETLETLFAAGVPKSAVLAPGQVPHREALRLLATAQVAVNCYEDVPSLRWNYVLKLPEFQSICVPVVSVDLPGAREYVQEGMTGMLFPPNDWAVAAQKVISVLNDVPMSGILARRARERVSLYDWPEINRLIAREIRKGFDK